MVENPGIPLQFRSYRLPFVGNISTSGLFRHIAIFRLSVGVEIAVFDFTMVDSPTFEKFFVFLIKGRGRFSPSATNVTVSRKYLFNCIDKNCLFK